MNATLNVLKRGLEIGLERAEYTPVGEVTATQLSEAGQVASVSQEAHLIVIDEAAFFHNDEAIFRNILPPMLATTGGALIVSSTPWGKNTVFYQLNQDPDY